MAGSPTRTKARAKATRQGWDPAQIRTELDARAVLDGGCRFDASRADRVVAFFEHILTHTDASTGQTGQFQLMAWQRDALLRPLFGWVRADGTRRFRRGGIWVPKKNGKSTIAAGLELYLLVADDEPVAEVYSAANDRQQASIIYGHAERMVSLSPRLRQRIGPKGIIRSTKTIHDAKSGSFFRALSADAPTKEGLNIHGLFVDEIHAMRSRVLWDTLAYGGAARRQPLILSISTAGVYDISSIGWEQYSYAREIWRGTNDRDWSFFSLMYEAPAEADWTREATWRTANPSYGVTVKPDAIREECTEAQADNRKQNTFRRYRLNQWVQQQTRWIPLHTWDANHTHAIDRAELRGRRAYAGLDLASVRDLTACAIVVECPHDPDAIDVLMRYWIPEDALADRHNRNLTLYQSWHHEGLLETTPGATTDYDFIEAAILKEAEALDLKVIAIDALFQGQSVANHLADEGLQVVAVPQGPKGQGPPMREFERLWRAGRVHHGGHPILRWNADNAEAKSDPDGNLKLVKPGNAMDPRKIDGLQALVHAIVPLSRELQTPEPKYQVMALRV